MEFCQRETFHNKRNYEKETGSHREREVPFKIRGRVLWRRIIEKDKFLKKCRKN
jgi:hypothetical protein